MLESLLCFHRYLAPLALSALTVFALAIFNMFIGPIIWKSHSVDAFEIFGYSVIFSGPFAFSISFIFYFYGLELLEEPWPFAKMAFISSSILMAIGLVIDIMFIPRMRQPEQSDQTIQLSILVDFRQGFLRCGDSLGACGITPSQSTPANCSASN